MGLPSSATVGFGLSVAEFNWDPLNSGVACFGVCCLPYCLSIARSVIVAHSNVVLAQY